MHQTRTLNGVLPRPGSVAPKMWELGAILSLLDLSFLTLTPSYETPEVPSMCLILSLIVVSPLPPFLCVHFIQHTHTHTHIHSLTMPSGDKIFPFINPGSMQPGHFRPLYSSRSK